MITASFTIARGLGPLPRMLEAARGAPAVARVFHAEGVPIEIASNQHQKLPLRSLMALMERGAREVGDDLFGIALGGAMRPEDFGPFARYMLAARDVRSLLARSTRAITYHQSGTGFSIKVSNDLVWWGYRVVEPISIGRRDHIDHILKPMLNGLRRYLGDSWVPSRIEVEYGRPKWWRELEDVFRAQVFFDMPTNAVVFEKRLLDRLALRPIPLGQLITGRDLRQLVAERPPRTQAEAVREIIRLRLLDSIVDIDGAAILLGIGPRTLQRQLAGENYTYRELVEQTRMERALALLRETAEPVTAIALSLGYSEIASFSRAFQRWTGFAPSRYRCRSGP
ncbi:AraC family transcriptional regulator [Methyloceanibacter caenitepidi]|uniref:Transcriptional regulator, AraC family n=1 Tax=Methyloceanibacter caenitepidi TaxID=1384459 RepID=A0A0A8K286_9HYPH|nr:AraC family transcriptional regulator [Methyloceanibacter caenitepidi]BAQ16637.1 transcriptional regulator, AraC family [Methyloceanibacter caenitepidi]